MAIVLKNNKYDLIIDSNTIIGVMGENYYNFISALKGEDVFYLDNRLSTSKKEVASFFDLDDKLLKIISEYNLDHTFLDKKVNELSHSEQKLLKYIMLITSNKRIVVIDEPFMDLDYDNRKKIALLIKKLIKNKKTVIIGSMDSNIVYSLCKQVLFISDKGYYYGDVTSFEDKNILKKYHIDIPDLVNFVNLVNDKKIKFRYSYDIRDLIKDVYRNVSQK